MEQLNLTIDDIIPTHPGNEKVNNAKMNTKHNQMSLTDWEILLQQGRNYWPTEPTLSHKKTIINLVRTLDTKQQGHSLDLEMPTYNLSRREFLNRKERDS